ncbi:MAG TPA: serine hydrolase [Candidatus Bipolaricaulota bacterium]|nr:serine hydrolase [Candidatus Bipolaricaulota bacterium]
MKKSAILILAGLLLWPSLTVATGERIVKFDQNTLKSGYSVKSFDDNFWLPIFPSQFFSPLEVKMWAEQVMAIPSGKKAVSNFYWYEVNAGQSGFLSKPVLLSLKFQGDSRQPKSLYFFDKSRQIWRALKSETRWDDNRINAWSPVPAASIVVLEDTTDYQPELTAESAISIDAKTGEILYGKNIDQIRPIASISKLITALVFLDHNPGWGDRANFVESDNVGGAGLNVVAGDSINIKDLFMATLLASKNNAARALMRSTGLSETEFVALMNQKAKELGALNTGFIEPTGLSEYNLSTARDLAKISRAAFSKFEFLEATTLKKYPVKIKTAEGDKIIWIENTNKLVDRDLYLLGGKTGYTEEAGRCLISKARGQGREVISLVLGSDISKNYDEVYELLSHFLK